MQGNHLNTDEFRSLRSTEIGKYFSDRVEGSGASLDALTFDRETLDRFHKDFEQLLMHRKGYQGLSKAADFRQWWKQNHPIYLTRPVVQTYIREGLTLGELLDDMHLHYMASQTRQRHASRAARVINRFTKRRFALAVVLPVVLVAHKIMLFFWNLLILGPGVQMVNSYTNPVITPLAQTAQQKGSQDLALASSAIQSWLTNRDKLVEVRHDLRQTTKKLESLDFKKMTPEQIQAKWAEFEQTYFEIFLRYNQTLPSHLRDGRSFFRDWMVFTPVGLSTNLASFDTQYWTHHREYEDAARAHDRKRMALHEAQMRASEDRIATTLAAWKIYEFMFPEFTREPLNANGQLDLKSSYKILIKSMRFDLYVKQFASRVTEILKQMDAQFLMQDQISRMTASSPKK